MWNKGHGPNFQYTSVTTPDNKDDAQQEWDGNEPRDKQTPKNRHHPQKSLFPFNLSSSTFKSEPLHQTNFFGGGRMIAIGFYFLFPLNP